MIWLTWVVRVHPLLRAVLKMIHLLTVSWALEYHGGNCDDHSTPFTGHIAYSFPSRTSWRGVRGSSLRDPLVDLAFTFRVRARMRAWRHTLCSRLPLQARHPHPALLHPQAPGAPRPTPAMRTLLYPRPNTSRTLPGNVARLLQRRPRPQRARRHSRRTLIVMPRTVYSS